MVKALVAKQTPVVVKMTFVVVETTSVVVETTSVVVKMTQVMVKKLTQNNPGAGQNNLQRIFRTGEQQVITEEEETVTRAGSVCTHCTTQPECTAPVVS